MRMSVDQNHACANCEDEEQVDVGVYRNRLVNGCGGGEKYDIDEDRGKLRGI